MTRRRRAVLLFGLALVLGVLAASDVVRRESRLRAQLGPELGVVVAQADLAEERELRAGDLAVRRVPRRYVPPDAVLAAEEVVGQRLAAPVARHGFVTRSSLELGEVAVGAPVRAGERAAEVLALGSPDVVVTGSRVDVLVTRERDEAAPGGAELALQDVEVLAAGPAAGAGGGADDDDGAQRVAATLRVTVRQAVYLAAAAAFARDVRLLARAAGDHRRSAPIAVGTTLR